MRSFLKFSTRSSRLLALAILVVVVATFVPATPAQAAAATHLKLSNVDTSLTALRDIDEILVEALDGANDRDMSYDGMVTFTASCGDCFDVSLAGGTSFAPLANKQYDFNGQPIPQLGDDGAKTLFIRWKELAVAGSPNTLTVTGPVAPSTVDMDDVSGINVASNAPTRLDLEDVDSGATKGVADPINVIIKNEAGQTNPNAYTGTVTFSSTPCNVCFTVTPNNGGNDPDKYTFVPGDNSTKAFTLTWTTAGAGRTFTATGTDLPTTPSETTSGITVVEPAATTTSTSTTSTSTTTTTAAPRPAVPMIVTGAGAGGGPHVIARKAADYTPVLSFFAYDAAFTGGVRVATGDVNNDGWDDIVTAPGPGGGPHVKVFSGRDSTTLASFFAYSPTFSGGVYVAAADVNDDGKADIITGAGSGGGPHVRVLDGTKLGLGADAAEIRGFFAYATGFTGGVRVAGGDFNKDGNADIVTGPGPGGGPHVRVFSGANGADLGGFMAYAASFTGGVYVAADPADEALVFTGAGEGGGRHVRLLNLDGSESVGFIAGPGTQGVVPAVGDSSGPAAEFFMVSRAVTNPNVQRVDFANGSEITSFAAYGAGVGVFVAVGVL